MELKTLSGIEHASRPGRPELFRFGIALIFIVVIMLTASVNADGATLNPILVAAAMIGGYTAMNIGATDVASHLGPAVGSKTLTVAGAIAIAAIFAAAGALTAGGEVVGTIKRGIIDPGLIDDRNTFGWLMMAALLAGALWLNLADALGAPASTTQAIVGGVLGAGVAAGGIGVADWSTVGTIAAAWVLSPVLGAIMAATLLYLIKQAVSSQADKKAAARRMVPILVAAMTWAFSTYLIFTGLQRLSKIDLADASLIGLGVSAFAYLIVKPIIVKSADRLPNKKTGVSQLFTIPLIFAAAMLSFAHGANDVAAIAGPLVAISEAALRAGVAIKAATPLWVMAVAALGIATGLALYGKCLLRTLGAEITELDQMHAFSIAMAASVTVIIATQLGLPVSSTHIVVGAILGVGLLRQYLRASYSKMVADIKAHHHGRDAQDIEAFLVNFRKATVGGKAMMLEQLKSRSTAAKLGKKERKRLQKIYENDMANRSALMKIAAAWLISAPASGLLAATLFFTIRGFMVP